jgi:hypothetical protein
MKRRKRRTEEDFKRYVSKICRNLRYFFLHGAYQMNIVYALEEDGPSDDGSSVAAEIKIDSAYLRFTITFYRAAYRKWQQGQFWEIILHEFCHLLTQPLVEYTDPHMPESTRNYLRILSERQTELISQVIQGNITQKSMEAKEY